MSTEKMARTSAATPERVEAGAETGQATTSTTNDTTPTPTGQAVKISDLLGHGQSAADVQEQEKFIRSMRGRAAEIAAVAAAVEKAVIE